jgi:hypothetical protein
MRWLKLSLKSLIVGVNSMAVSRRDPKKDRPRRPPATTPEARENQLISAAVDLAETQLSAGTASAQVITHYLKLGTTREQLEQEKLRQENELLKAKVESLASMARIEEMYSNALNAMRTYQGGPSPDERVD